jgi:hypothetical protein
MQRLSGFTRGVILSRAADLGLSFAVRRPWSEAEMESLREELGTSSKSQIAKRMGRTYYSVKAQVSKMVLSSRVTADYSQQDVQQLFGVGRKRVYQWVRNGWLQLLNDRITEKSLERFLRQHPGEYQLSRIDEAWFKGMLFPAFGRFSGARESSSSRLSQRSLDIQ